MNTTERLIEAISAIQAERRVTQAAHAETVREFREWLEKNDPRKPPDPTKCDRVLCSDDFPF